MASGAPYLFTIRLSAKGYSRSRMTRVPRRMRSLWRSSSFSLRGVSFKIQNPPTRCLQSQLLVTGKRLDTLKVSQDFMWAMLQHRNVLAADTTKEIARFATCICKPSDEEPTHFICPTPFSFCTCALTAHDDGLRSCHLCQQHVDPNVHRSVPNFEERHLIL